MSDRFDCAVVGAGVVGLAIARELALSGRAVIVLEQNGQIGEETSSRNSEVIHAGIYYPTGSLKARWCVEGKALLYEYLQARALPHRRIGKLIVAVSETERSQLDAIAGRARDNGVDDLALLDAAALHAMEPELRGVSALWSPSTGILDVHALMLSLQGDLESADGIVALNAEVDSFALGPAAVRLSVRSDDQLTEIEAATLINAAGLHATALARNGTGLDQSAVPETFYAKGNYFVYEGRSPFGHLVYPVPVEGGLGIHATLDLAGRVRFGPDVEWSDGIDYVLDESRAATFYAAIRTYWQGLPDGALAPGYVGVRPKLAGPGEHARDFMIDDQGSAQGGRLIQLFGIESPGLTSCLAIGRHVAAVLNGGA